MKSKAKFTFLGALVAVLAALFAPQLLKEHDPSTAALDERAPLERVDAPAAKAGSSAAPSADRPAKSSSASSSAIRHADIGFRSRAAFDEHFEKHGGEFGKITQDEYLRLAQTLRDAKVGGDVLEIVRDDGVSSRFDKQSGAFLAFNRDLTLRTFFKPNDGVRYFERQAEREH